jgi:hypothetical protein
MFEKYISKLDPQCPFLWQLPLSRYTREGVWYKRKAGRNTISNFMKVISTRCGLSTVYTNHCVRATACTMLGEQFTEIDIQAISGHKSLSGLSHYKRVNDNHKITMTNSLCNIMGITETLDNTIVAETLPHEDKANVGELPQSNLLAEPLANMDETNVDNAFAVLPLLTDLDMDQILSREVEKMDRPLQMQGFFNKCSNFQVTINFNNK